MDPRPDHGEESYKGSGHLLGRKALITGGDSGTGRAAAIAFAREGADVAICYYPTEEPDAQEVVALIKAAGRKAVPLPGDIREEAFCQKMVQDAINGLEALDILVSNAARQQTRCSSRTATSNASPRFNFGSPRVRTVNRFPPTKLVSIISAPMSEARTSTRELPNPKDLFPAWLRLSNYQYDDPARIPGLPFAYR
jgi:NAD(P)-dependent dehydrogenase (short-subunit alcohol dehydrogenase family)